MGSIVEMSEPWLKEVGKVRSEEGMVGRVEESKEPAGGSEGGSGEEEESGEWSEEDSEEEEEPGEGSEEEAWLPDGFVVGARLHQWQPQELGLQDEDADWKFGDPILRDEVDGSPLIGRMGSDPIFTLVLHGTPDQIRKYLTLHPSKLDYQDPREDCYQGQTPLHLAARAGRAEIINLLMGMGSQSLDVKTHWHETVLIEAVESGNVEAIRTVLKWMPVEFRSKLIDKSSIYGNTPLHLVTGPSDVIITDLLIRFGGSCSVNHQGDGGTPLHWAIGHGRLEIVESLLRAGAEVNLKDDNGETPLEICIQTRQLEYLEMILLLRAFGATSLPVAPRILSRWPKSIQIALTEPATEEMILWGRGRVFFQRSLTQTLIEILWDLEPID